MVIDNEDIEKGVEDTKHIVDNAHICVSDEKILTYIDYYNDKINEFSKYN